MHLRASAYGDLLHGSPVSDLSPLARLNKLEVIYLTATQVSDLSPLARLNKLEVLQVNAAIEELEDRIRVLLHGKTVQIAPRLKTGIRILH